MLKVGGASEPVGKREMMRQCSTITKRANYCVCMLVWESQVMDTCNRAHTIRTAVATVKLLPGKKGQTKWYK